MRPTGDNKVHHNHTTAVVCAHVDYITSATDGSYTKMREIFMDVFFIVRSYIIIFSVLRVGRWGFKTM